MGAAESFTGMLLRTGSMSTAVRALVPGARGRLEVYWSFEPVRERARG
jgi:hypothetical protein